jgi:hypothetical protein
VIMMMRKPADWARRQAWVHGHLIGREVDLDEMTVATCWRYIRSHAWEGDADGGAGSAVQGPFFLSSADWGEYSIEGEDYLAIDRLYFSEHERHLSFRGLALSGNMISLWPFDWSWIQNRKRVLVALGE